MSLSEDDLYLIPESTATDRKIDGQAILYTREYKIEVAFLLLLHSNYDRVSEITGVPRQTMQKWAKEPWWPLALAFARERHDKDLTAGYLEVVRRAQNKLIERIETGDVVVSKDGQERFKPVNAKDLAIISSIAFDKRQIATGGPTSISARKQDTTQKAAQLRELARAKVRAHPAAALAPQQPVIQTAQSAGVADLLGAPPPEMQVVRRKT